MDFMFGEPAPDTVDAVVMYDQPPAPRVFPIEALGGYVECCHYPRVFRDPRGWDARCKACGAFWRYTF